MGASASTEVNVRQPGFFVGFAAYARSVPPADWRTYLRWHAARAAAPVLSKAFQDEDFAFNHKKLNGTPEPEPAWRRVQAATDMALGEAVGPIYVARAFSPKAKERMRVLVENMRAALKERIDALPWMGAETKAAAQKKLAAFNVKIGYPDVWKDYSALVIARDVPFAENVRRARVFETKRNLAKLGKPIERNEWNMTPPTVNAYYNASLNEIVFPAGILQPPFFYEDADDAVNYGGIGVVIGHEMSHGFDDSGSQYDADGNLKNWWTADDRKAYDARTALIVKQFDSYKPLPDQSINGKLTLGENIGDLGGIKIAYAAHAEGSRRKARGEERQDRRFHARAALLPLVRDDLAQPVPRRGDARAAEHEPAQPRQVARPRPAVEPAGVLRRVRLRRRVRPCGARRRSARASGSTPARSALKKGHPRSDE